MAAEPFLVPYCEAQPELLHEDEHLLFVNKPAGLLSVPGRHPSNRDCLISRLQETWPSALIVHRLDMDTSGVMVIALNKESHAFLGRQFQERQAHKTYEAVVEGLIEEERGVIDLPLITDWPNRPLQKVCHRDGKQAITAYEVIDQDLDSRTTRVKLEPLTGRSHQLRVHMKEIGHPIRGDKFYGLTSKDGQRLLLHATRLEICHPDTGKPMTIISSAEF